jgi:glutathione synthase/RimK-type ligase-like ATP-grasp enzyme
MTKNVLILTEPGDAHAYAVAESLARRGVEVTLWYTADFPMSAGEAILLENGRRRLSVQGPALNLREPSFDVVWHRRPCYVLDEQRLHPADREFADLECGVFRRSLFNLLAPEAFWINPPDAAARAGRKPLQQSVAMDAGLATPATLYTNDPHEIRKFLARHGDQIVYKPFRAVSWRDDETYWMPYTSLLTPADLIEDSLLRAVPGIYQELVPKAFELRVTVIGHQVLAAKVLSQSTETGRLDWRKAYHELRMEPYTLPPEIAGRCRDVVARLGLVFGCIDLVVTPQDDFVFLEVNEMGQFLFVEHYAGVPLLDAFTEFLIQGKPDFVWRDQSVSIHYEEVLPAVDQKIRRPVEYHVVPPDRAVFEGNSEASVPRTGRRVARA